MEITARYLLALRLPSNLESACRAIQSRLPFHPLMPPFIPLRWIAAPLEERSLQELRKRQPLRIEGTCFERGDFLWIDVDSAELVSFSAALPRESASPLLPCTPYRIFLGVDHPEIALPTEIPRITTGALSLTEWQFTVHGNPWWEAFQWRLRWSRRITVRARAPRRSSEE